MGDLDVHGGAGGIQADLDDVTAFAIAVDHAADEVARNLETLGRVRLGLTDDLLEAALLVPDLVAATEAAALGVPVYSIFRGTIGAVDRYLSETGRLTLLEEPGDLAKKLRIQKRNIESGAHTASKETLQQVVSHIIDLAERRKPVLSHGASF